MFSSKSRRRTRQFRGVIHNFYQLIPIANKFQASGALYLLWGLVGWYERQYYLLSVAGRQRVTMPSVMVAGSHHHHQGCLSRGNCQLIILSRSALRNTESESVSEYNLLIVPWWIPLLSSYYGDDQSHTTTYIRTNWLHCISLNSKR